MLVAFGDVRGRWLVALIGDVERCSFSVAFPCCSAFCFLILRVRSLLFVLLLLLLCFLLFCFNFAFCFCFVVYYYQRQRGRYPLSRSHHQYGSDGWVYKSLQCFFFLSLSRQAGLGVGAIEGVSEFRSVGGLDDRSHVYSLEARQVKSTGASSTGVQEFLSALIVGYPE